MINEIEITGFQSHKSTTIQFDKGVNVIIGSNDSGKSAIFRALSWVFQNRPLGEAFKNWDFPKGEPVTVGIDFGENWIIKRRSKGKNIYETEEQTIEALKTDLPEEVTNVTKISEINLQSQHDRYFLLQDSPGEVAKKFNEIVGLDIIDVLFRRLNSSILSLRNADSEYEHKINELDTQISERAYLDGIKPEIEKLETLVNTQESLEKESNSLKTLIEKLKAINEEIENAGVDDALEEKVCSLIVITEGYSKKRVLTNRLSSIVSAYKKNEQSLNDTTEWLNIESPVMNIKKMFDKGNSLADEQKGLNSFVEDYKGIEKRLSEKEKELESFTNKHKALLKKAGVCPLCGSKMQ